MRKTRGCVWIATNVAIKNDGAPEIQFDHQKTRNPSWFMNFQDPNLFDPGPNLVWDPGSNLVWDLRTNR